MPNLKRRMLSTIVALAATMMMLFGVAATPAVAGPVLKPPTRITGCDNNIISTDILNDLPGAFFCSYGYNYVYWTDGRLQYFVVGTNHQVYTSYEYSKDGVWSPWISLGGWARDGVRIEGLNNPSRTLRIVVEGSTIGAFYANYWNGTVWSGWMPYAA